MNTKSIFAVLAAMLMLVGVASASVLNLVEKDTSDWSHKVGGASVTMTYNEQGTTFDYTLTGTVPLLNEDYTLIYYVDNEPTGTPESFINPGVAGKIIGTATSDENGNILASGSVTMSSIPWDVDPNSALTANDDNPGAKIWLVPSEDIVDGINWADMANFLYEENLSGAERGVPSHLIKYTQTVLSDGSSDTATTESGLIISEVSNLAHSGITKNSITWTWGNPTGTNFIGTRVTVSSGGVPLSGYDQKVLDTETETITLSDLNPGTSYTILVQTEWIN